MAILQVLDVIITVQLDAIVRVKAVVIAAVVHVIHVQINVPQHARVHVKELVVVVVAIVQGLVHLYVADVLVIVLQLVHHLRMLLQQHQIYPYVSMVYGKRRVQVHP